MATAIALIVAGTGETSEQEVFDLLEDAYPEADYEEVGLVVPVDKDLFSKTVQHAVEWAPDDGVYPILTKGATQARGSKGLGDVQEADSFAANLNKEEFKDWDEVQFLVALPDDPEDPDYDLYASLVEVAIDNGIPVKDLTKGLDDVTLSDPEPEPEPPAEEPEKPARRSRSRKAAEEPTEEPAAPEEAPDVDGTALQREINAAAAAAEPLTDNQSAFEALGDVIDGLIRLREFFAPVQEVNPVNPEPVEEEDTLERLRKEMNGTPKKRGRGRPRTQFEVKQILDDDDEWVPRPAGRLRKGTEWRTIHAETDEVLDSGTA